MFPKTDITHFHSYAESRPKSNDNDGNDMIVKGSRLGRERTGRGKERMVGAWTLLVMSAPLRQLYMPEPWQSSIQHCGKLVREPE
jgi:hypothetical protein